MIGEVSPTPTDEELVAIVAAVEAAWPRPVVVVDDGTSRVRRAGDGAWKWSGRWWALRKVPADRRRP